MSVKLEMKRTDLPWTDVAPVHWKRTKLKRLFKVQSGDFISPEDEAPEGFPIYGGNDVRGYATKWNTEGPILLLGRVGARCGCVRRVDGKFWASEHALRMFSRKPCDLKFIERLLAVIDFNKFAIRTAQPLITGSQVGEQDIELPPLIDQRRIGGYLDEATGKVDRLVALRRRQMELLREQRAALIQQAVTGGLNPKATLKDSGLPWLGQIPKHWKIKRLKHLSPRQSVGLVINPSTYVVDEGIPFLFGSDISEGSISIEKVRRISPESNALLKASRLNAGDLVSVRVGYPGITAVIPPELDQCNCASLLIIRQSKSFHSQWLCHTMNSPVGRFQVGLVQYGAAQEQFNVGHAVDFVFPTPPLAEQREIADFIDSEYVRLGQLNAAYTRQLELLTEYRAALIHESVTGQRAVPAIRLAEKPAGRYAALET